LPSIIKREDFGYWKNFKVGEEIIYTVGVLIYDHRQLLPENIPNDRVGLQYECLLMDPKRDRRIDLSVSASIDYLQFEKMAKRFYNSMKRYINISDELRS